MQHFANYHHITRGCRICLNMKKTVFDSFYALLKDFDYHLQLAGEEDLVDLESFFLSLNIDTSILLPPGKRIRYCYPCMMKNI